MTVTELERYITILEEAADNWAEVATVRPAVEPQVFGPGRPAAARQAISALAIATEARQADPFDHYGTHAQLVAATEARNAYSDYGDTFTSH